MAIQESIVGLIEVDVPEGRSLATVLDSLMLDDISPPHAAMCRVSRNVLPSRKIPADLTLLTDSLNAEHRVAIDRLRSH
jgi:hypothetical protein